MAGKAKKNDAAETKVVYAEMSQEELVKAAEEQAEVIKQQDDVIKELEEKLEAAMKQNKKANLKPTVKHDGKTYEIMHGVKVTLGDKKYNLKAEELKENPDVIAHLVEVGSSALSKV